MAKNSTKSTTKKPKIDSVDYLRSENEALKQELAKFQKIEDKKAKKRNLFWRSLSAGILAVIAVTTFTLFNISYWVKDTVVDTNQFVSTLQPLIKDPEIQKTLQTEITNQVFAQINLEEELKKALPENLQFIAGPFAGQVQSFTSSKIGDVLDSEQAYTVWTKTLAASQSKILAYIEDPNNSGVITVNSVYELAGTELKGSDVGFLFGKTLPSSVGSIQLANIEGVPKARQALNVLRQVTTALAVVSLVSAALAIAISPRRRNMIIGLAVFTLLLMLSTLFALQIASTQIGSSVQAQFTAAAEATYAIITAPLKAQTEGVAALIGSTIIIAILSSSWSGIVWLRSQMRKSLDWLNTKVVRSWSGSHYIDWFATNHIVIAWTLVGVCFAAFALRIPPTVSGVKQALIVSAVAVIVLEVLASVSRVTKK